MQRRSFLGSIAAAPLVLGLDDLLLPRRFRDGDVPEFWTKAKARMAATGRPGLVLVAPADPESEQAFGYRLAATLSEPDGFIRREREQPKF